MPRLSIMPLGDSITDGAGSSTMSSYRADLWKQLSGRADRLDFVGSLQSGSLPDRDHEGHSGWMIHELQADVETWLYNAKPNVVLLHIGTNDMARHPDPDGAPARLGALIDQIVAAAPGITVVVAGLVPSSKPEIQARIKRFNAAVPGVVAQRREQGHSVTHVTMDTLTSSDLNDELHPNDRGYVKMANHFYAGLGAAHGLIREDVVVKPPPNSGAGPVNDGKVDINGDGKADYVVVHDNGALDAWLNNGAGDASGGWRSIGRIAAGGQPGSKVRLADLNGDRRADYLVLHDNGALDACVNKGLGDVDGGWTCHGRIAGGVGASGSKVRLTDINGDGKADYLVVQDNGAVDAWANVNGLGDANGGWKSLGRVAAGVGASGSKIRLADLNGDRRADYLVLHDSGAVDACVNKGAGDASGGWTCHGKIAGGVGAPGRKVRLADINGDGKADYVVLQDNGAMDAWANVNGAGDANGGWKSLGRVAGGTGHPASRVRI